MELGFIGRIRRRLRKKFTKKFGHIFVFNVEEVLTQTVQSKRYLKLVEFLRNSLDEAEFKRRELIIQKIEKVPFGTELVDLFARLPNRWALWERFRKLFPPKEFSS